MKKLLIPAFCLFHMIAIFWWALPHSFGEKTTETFGQTFEARLFEWMALDESSSLNMLFQQYINVTGSQQYWDFFAPHSPKYHQYLSVCDSVVINHEQGIVECRGKAFFSNLDDNFKNFKRFGSDRSRLYRLTENLANLEDAQLLEAFTQYYRKYHHSNVIYNSPALLVLHQFELHPELKDLPKAGYRMDKVLWISH